VMVTVKEFADPEKGVTLVQRGGKRQNSPLLRWEHML